MMKIKLILGIALVACLYIFFYALGPILLVGQPLPLFSIRNEDAKVHQVLVEILDANKSIKFTH